MLKSQRYRYDLMLRIVSDSVDWRQSAIFVCRLTESTTKGGSPMAQSKFPTFTITIQNPYPSQSRGEWIEEVYLSKEEAQRMIKFYVTCGVAVKKDILVK